MGKKLGGLRLSGGGHGTHFIIMPTEEILIDDISTSDSNKTSEQSSRLEKALLGFTNTMYSDSNPPIIARFRDYLEDGECIDRISESIFLHRKNSILQITTLKDGSMNLVNSVELFLFMVKSQFIMS